MLNESSENDSYLDKLDSDDPSLNRKYSRKSKFIKKKNQESGYLPNRKKRCPLFDQGKCRNGGLCSFSHSFIPDIAKVVLFLFRNNVKILGSTLAKKANFAHFLTIFQDSLANSGSFLETAGKGEHAAIPTKILIQIFIKIFLKIILILFSRLSSKAKISLKYFSSKSEMPRFFKKNQY